jgi:hypothetical protein
MQISKEVKSLTKRIYKCFDRNDGPIEHLMISFEYDFSSKKWQVTPVYECAGDGHPLYMGTPFDSKYVLQGEGKKRIIFL